jgi:hypothetical protein
LISPDAGAAVAKPKAGSYSGPIDDQPFDGFGFVVSGNHRKISHEVGSAPSGTGGSCTGDPYSIPQDVVKIHNGHFSESENNYPHHVRVTVTGSFVSKTKATGHLTVDFPHSNNCDARTKVRATFVPPS